MKLPEIDLREVVAELERRKWNRIEDMFKPNSSLSIEHYPKHKEFIESTAEARECVLMAANRIGKTELACFMATVWATGDYPTWWCGKSFNKPVKILMAGESSSLVRDSLQTKLLGQIGEYGSGLVPRDCIDFDKMQRKMGVAEAYDRIYVKHISGGLSMIQFQSYDQGRDKFQATAYDVILLDEEPPLLIYSECVMRTMTTNGVVLSTFTPLLGMSETVLHLRHQAEAGRVKIITATWDDAPHLTDEAKKELFDSLPPYQRDARSKGIPQLGSGAIYPVPESDYLINPIQIPEFWKRGFGMDVGWNNTAACWLAYDSDNDVMYVTGDYKRGQVEPSVHADAIRGRGKALWGVIDPASRGRSQIDGDRLIDVYRNLGLNIVSADNSVEAGLHEVLVRLTTGRLKIFNTCQQLIEEMRLYRRDEKGRVVKEHDHIMDAMRYVVNSFDRVPNTSKDKPVVDKTFYQGFNQREYSSPTSWMR